MFSMMAVALVELRVVGDRAEALNAVSFVLNSLSKKRVITRPELDGDKIVFSLDDYGISNWGSFASKYPYKGMMRSDWFVAKALVEPYYSELLGPKTQLEFEKLLGKSNQEVSAIVTSGSVIRSIQKISRFATLNGGFWVTEVDDTSFMLGALPNGLIAYYGKADPKVMADGRCIRCHNGNGIIPFVDDVRKLKKDKDIEVRMVESVVENFMVDIDSLVKVDQTRYREALKLVGKDVIKSYNKIVEGYESPVTFEKAAKECGLSETEFRAWCSRNILGIHLMKGGKLSREQWESLRP